MPVNAVTESTNRYLTFLRNNNLGVSRLATTDIKFIHGEPRFFDNLPWNVYSCHLPPRLNVQQDTAATFIPNIAPGNEIEIRLLSYDRPTGNAKIASQTKLADVAGPAGHIVIDFRWLVHRFLEWYQQRGATIPRNIPMILASVDELPDQFMIEEGLGEEQRAAVKTMLTSRLSYVWGPPGTGKTTWVLAKAVRYCVERNQKVLVLAPTNLAVDNALSAVLNENVPKSQVIRLGLPTDQFKEKYPECIEERAYRQEIGRLQAEIRELRSKIASSQEASRLAESIKQAELELDQSKAQAEELKSTLSASEGELRGKQDALACWTNRRSSLDNQLVARRSQRDELQFPELLADIEILEHEQTRIIKDVAAKEAELQSMGLLSRLFTGNKQKFLHVIAGQRHRLLSVEVTLESKRERHKQLAPLVSQLNDEIGVLEGDYREARSNLAKITVEADQIEVTLASLHIEITGEAERINRLETQLRRETDELSHLFELCPLENHPNQIAEWEEMIAGLETRITRYHHDLSQKKVVGMTLDGFIGLTSQTGITADHVFIDEAPYAPLAKVLPLLSLHCPISMLGDHLQLPPVCECENDAAVRAYWAKPAIFLERAFHHGNNWAAINGLDEPTFPQTNKQNLTKSYRFGRSLAEILNRRIYGNIGLTGLADNTRIRCINCSPRDIAGHIGRENAVEADEIITRLTSWWEWASQQPTLPTIAILTAYKNQARLIRKRLNSTTLDTAILNHVEVWNTHQAQGREWDWVLFSVSDTANLEGNDPFLTDDRLEEGRAVLNTTISRAKQHLIVFMDMNYWVNCRPQSLLGELACRH